MMNCALSIFLNLWALSFGIADFLLVDAVLDYQSERGAEISSGNIWLSYFKSGQPET